MKLTGAQIQKVQNQFDAQAIPEHHAAAPPLEEAFGDHTFFVNLDGLHIVETTPAAEGESQVGTVVKVAGWADEERTKFRRHEPQPMPTVVDLGSDELGPEESDPAA
ncbi:MAG: hypothetical protein ACE5Q3_11465 [Alphaproteobacteria bacterium]